MPITVLDEKEKETLLIGYKTFIHKRSLKEFAKKIGYGDDGGGYMELMFKEVLIDDPYEYQQELSEIKDRQVLLSAIPPAAPVEENLYLDFDEFYNYLAEVVDERISESPEDKEEYEQLLAEVKIALEL